MRRAIAASLAMMVVGAGVSYTLFGRNAHKETEAMSSAAEGQRIETARLFTAPIATPPANDLIAAKLAPQSITWPDVPKPVVKAKALKAAHSATKPKKPNPKKQIIRATGSL